MTIPELIRIWCHDDIKRWLLSPKVERVVSLWYAHGARLPRTDTLRRSSPQGGFPVETQGWLYVDESLDDPLKHALAGVISAEGRHPVTEALAFKALDILADLEGNEHGFILELLSDPLCEAEKIERDVEQANAIAEAKHGTGKAKEERKPVPPRFDAIRGRFARELGLKEKEDRAA